MLVLSRKAGEEIAVNNGDITISVLGITGNKVRLGVSGPRESPYIGWKSIVGSFKQSSPRRSLKRTLPESCEGTRQFAGPARGERQMSRLPPDWSIR